MKPLGHRQGREGLELPEVRPDGLREVIGGLVDRQADNPVRMRCNICEGYRAPSGVAIQVKTGELLSSFGRALVPVTAVVMTIVDCSPRLARPVEACVSSLLRPSAPNSTLEITQAGSRRKRRDGPRQPHIAELAVIVLAL